ncbi:hypothetical protein BGZ63DRAFT_349714 [Mariannaea sp. PMI_226]|nr:hypothetical protein BGZ63DRAFT_349714 [Mariannaea sp. PMI_226]
MEWTLLSPVFSVWIFLLARAVTGSGICAFWTQRGVQIAIQNSTTGEIHYSNCNGDGHPIFPVDQPNILPAHITPRNGTALAATGWWDTQKVVVSIFYQSEDHAIVNGFYECNMQTGHLVRKGEYVISLAAGVGSVNNQTGLAVELLGSTEGYRVMYHNRDKEVMMMSYSDTGGWVDAGAVSLDIIEGFALASAHYGNRNISVVFPRDSENFEVSRIHDDDLWHLETFPNMLNGTYTNKTSSNKIDISSTSNSSLSFWEPKMESIVMSIDSSASRSVFYIGSDKNLHQIVETGGEWAVAENQSNMSWPTSDAPGANLGLAYNSDTGEVWIYYQSNGSLVQLHQEDSGQWGTPISLPTSSTSSSGDSSPSAKVEDQPEKDQLKESSGLSRGAKIGLGVGVSLGVLATAVLIFLLMRWRRVSSSQNQELDVTNNGTVQIDQDIPEMDGSSGGYQKVPMTTPFDPAPALSERTHLGEMEAQTGPALLREPILVYELDSQHNSR